MTGQNSNRKIEKPKNEDSRVQATHSAERLRADDSRELRPTTRDREVVKLPDGREFIRTPRTSSYRDGSQSDLPKKPGFRRRWVSANLPGQLQRVIDLGYKPATDENGMEIAPVRGGINKQGETFVRYAMEISEEQHKLIERKKKDDNEKLNEETRDKMRGADLGFNSSTYMGHDSQRFVTKQT